MRRKPVYEWVMFRFLWSLLEFGLIDRFISSQEAGIDVRMGDIGAAIQEAMESYEVEVNGKTLPGTSMLLLSSRLSRTESLESSHSEIDP